MPSNSSAFKTTVSIAMNMPALRVGVFLTRILLIIGRLQSAAQKSICCGRKGSRNLFPEKTFWMQKIFSSWKWKLAGRELLSIQFMLV